MEALAIVALLVALFLFLVAVVLLRQRRRARGLTSAEAAHAWHREQRKIGDDGQGIIDHGH